MTLRQGSSVRNEQNGYSRGLILGFTMAESMLLLVFCLLLAAGALIMKAQDDVKKAEAEKSTLQGDLEKSKNDLTLLTQQLGIVMESANPSADMSELWKELSLSRQAVQKMREQKVSLQEAVDNAAMLREIIDAKLTAERVGELAGFLEFLQQKELTLNKLMELAHLGEELKHLELTVEQAKKLEPAIDLIKRTLLVIEDKTSRQVLEELIAAATVAKAMEAELASLKQEPENKPHAWPPIINLSETKGYSFKSGSAELDPRFRQVLETTVAMQIAEIAHQYGVDVIEVVGHTDEQGMGKRQSNMDYNLKPVLEGIAPIFTLQPGDNAGLGLARAIAVTQTLKTNPNLAAFTILPMSGAQLTLPNDSLTNGDQLGDIADRRRIEIRVRKRNGQKERSDPAIPSADAPDTGTELQRIKY